MRLTSLNLYVSRMSNTNTSIEHSGFVITCVPDSKSRRIEVYIIINNTDHKSLPLFIGVVIRVMDVVADGVIDKVVVGFIVADLSVVG